MPLADIVVSKRGFYLLLNFSAGHVAPLLDDHGQLKVPLQCPQCQVQNTEHATSAALIYIAAELW